MLYSLDAQRRLSRIACMRGCDCSEARCQQCSESMHQTRMSFAILNEPCCACYPIRGICCRTSGG